MNVKELIELIAAATLVLGMLGGLAVALKRGLGPRVIQFVGTVTLIPSVLILGIEKIIDAPTLGTLIGALTGYLLSGVSEPSVAPRRDQAVPPVGG